MQVILGLDIGGTKCAVAMGKTDGENIELLDKITFSTEVQKGVKYSINKIVENVEVILQKNKKSSKDIEAAGISCGGPLDSKRGIIMSPPNLIGWDNIPIVDIFQQRFGIKTRLQNDANACALAEWRFGAAKGFSNVIFLTFGTGMGAGLILDGRLYCGTNDMAGEIGHVRLAGNGPAGYGKAGSFEGFCSGGGIAQLAKTRVMEKLQMGEKVSFCDSLQKMDGLNAKVVGDAAEAGDELAKEIYQISGYYLGMGLSILIDILNPEIIVIGSIFLKSGCLLSKSAMEVVKKESLNCSMKACRIVPAGLGDRIGDYAALAAAISY